MSTTRSDAEKSALDHAGRASRIEAVTRDLDELGEGKTANHEIWSQS